MTEQPPSPGSSPGPDAGAPTCYRHPQRETWIRCQRCDRPICPDCMRDAAVGFQCPSCVAEGARSTRSGRTAYGGLRPTNASTTSIALVVANAAVWIAIVATGGASSRLVDLLALRPNGLCVAGNQIFDTDRATCPPGATWLPGVIDGAWWQPLTSMFTHVEVWHIGFNMLALWILGPQLELALGRWRFLSLYLLSGLAGSTMVFWLSNEYRPTLGASGAVYGLLAALLVVAHKVGGNYRDILGWIGVNFVITFVVANISWQGHVGGFVGGLLLAGAMVYAPRERRTAVQVGAIAAFAVLLAVLFAVRFVQLS